MPEDYNCGDEWCCGPVQPTTTLASDEALAELRRKLAGPEDSDRWLQREHEYLLKITGPDFVADGAPDFMVDVTGEALTVEIAKIISDAEQKIADMLGNNWTVTLGEV